jgi:RimJ/RimL family protein N-acetyltransferase
MNQPATPFMMLADEKNEFGQHLGLALPDWQALERPGFLSLKGLHVRLEPMDPERHGPELHAATHAQSDNRNWTYLPYGPFPTLAQHGAWLANMCARPDLMLHAILDRQHGRVIGTAAYLRIDPDNGCLGIGHIHFAPALRHTAAGTEVISLLLTQAFNLGYRRCDWQCNALNTASCRAAERLGFSWEGLFRQAGISKGRSRDTAWYAMTNQDWPALRATHEAWLAAGNFDRHGRQKQSLSAMTRPLIRPAPGPA